MRSKFKLILYYLNISAIGISAAGSVFALVMTFLCQSARDGWLIAMLTCLSGLVLFSAFYLIRKFYFPLAGKDYF